MLKSFIVTITMGVLLASCYAPQRDCDAYKVGSFQFEYTLGDSIKMGKFVRDDQYSVDYYDGQVDSASIRWVNNCEFVLQDLKSKVAIHYKIISTTDSSYTFEYRNAIRNPNKKLIVKTGTAFKTN